ncbi:MAG: Rrf2 family transcriptional regulator [Planktotalea sp.]|uniref:RrF2 family transcriptional regulator n=1 Tax=Planktotalea sp. TaxID=2029877 RepID=UPI003C72BF1A
MQLDKFSDYALRILIALEAHAPDKLATSGIAQMYGVSENHLSKIATQLAKNGFVVSERGRGGGLTLAKQAREISIGAVLRALKRDQPVVECFGSNSTCTILPACGLRAPLLEAQEAFFSALDGYSLADVASAKTPLKMLLALD